MSGELTLRRPTPPRAMISLVPMIDVMLILLVFFMVTSTYLNLDMIPAVSQRDAPESVTAENASQGASLLIRLGADGQPTLRGQPLNAAQLDSMLRARVAADPQVQVIVLPTGSARMQSLVTLMDQITQAGISRLRVVRLEARP